jgi:ubiquinone/menaquinone biosynthesis C-methylase UbiE
VEHYGDLCSEVYDLTKPVGGEYPDVGYYTRRLRSLGGTEGRSLEVAAGTGRLLVPLLEAGFAVDGVDSSAWMLELCRRSTSYRSGASPRTCTRWISGP